MTCPIARSLERVGEWWSMLIMRDALHGMTRFDEFQNSLGIAPNMLTRRLNSLVGAGLLERRRYSEHPPRHKYVPTARGRDLRPVIISLLTWGNKHFAPEGPSVMLVNRKTGAAVDPILADPATGRPVEEPDYTLHPGRPQAPGPGRDMAFSMAQRHGHESARRETVSQHQTREANEQTKRSRRGYRRRTRARRSLVPALCAGRLSCSRRRTNGGQDRQSG